MNANERQKEIRKLNIIENRMKLLAVLGPMFLYIIIVSSFASFDSRGAVLGFLLIVGVGVGLRIYVANYYKNKRKELLEKDVTNV